MDKKWSLDHIMWRSIITGSWQSCSSQDHVDTLKLRQRWKRHKEELSWQAQVYPYMFYFSLEYRSSYYKEGCNKVILTKPKCSKPREIPWVMEGNQIPRVCRNLSLQSNRYWTPVRPVGHIQEQVRSTGLVRSLYQLSKLFTGLVRYWTRLVR
jgi:hypothetical protein